MAAGTIAVNAASNDVTNLAAETSSGTITYQDANALTLQSLAASASGNYPGSTGSNAIATSSANVDIKSGGLLKINNDIVAGSGTVYLTSGAGITEGSGEDHSSDAGDGCSRCNHGEQRRLIVYVGTLGATTRELGRDPVPGRRMLCR